MAHIQFYYPKRLSFCPEDFENPGLGGGESSIVLLSRELARHGHNVEVFCACWNPKVYEGVTWRGAWEFDNADAPDILVHVRTKSSVVERKAKQHIFWMLDDRVDGALHFSELYPNCPIVVASNAMIIRLNNAGCKSVYKYIDFPIETNRFIDSPLPSESKICLHTSMPNRGLVHLINMWPRIKEAVPDAKLIATSGWELWGYTPEEAADRLRKTVGINIEDCDVLLTGVIPRRSLINLVKESRIGVIPSTFPEMYCLSAAEFAVAGKPMVVSGIEALAERVDNNKTGFRIDGDISSKKVQLKFVNKVVELLSNNMLADEMGKNAKKYAEKMSCNSVSMRWIELFN